MNDRPTASELLEAVGRFLREDAISALEGPARYHARVAAHVVSMVARELECEESHLRGEWERLAGLLGGNSPPPAERTELRDGVRTRSETLVARIRAGDADRGPWRRAVLDHLEQTVADKLEVARPPR